MSKSDSPALRLVVERGPKLAPASAFDAERLDTFKVGRVLRFTPVEEADRKDIRRWWAILNRAVKDTKTPWRTATQASEAIKLALGIVEYGKTVGGQFMQWPKSLKELDDEELAEAVRDMAALLHKMTGVDPLEWSKEAADVGQDETEQPEAPVNPASGSGSGEVSSPPCDPAPEQSETAPPAGERIQSAQDGAMEPASATSQPEVDAGSHQSPAADLKEDGAEPGESSVEGDAPSSDLDPVKRMLMEECIDNMLRDAFSEPAIERPAKVDKLERVFLEPQNLGSHPIFVKLCAETARRIIGKPQERGRAREYLMGRIS
jgi:hypothetical protein